MNPNYKLLCADANDQISSFDKTQRDKLAVNVCRDRNTLSGLLSIKTRAFSSHSDFSSHQST